MSDEILTRYLGGELGSDEEREAELRLFAGELDGDELDWRGAATLAMRRAVVRGSFDGTITREQLERLRAEHRVKVVRYGGGASFDVDMSGDYDLFVIDWALDLRGVARLDTELCDEQGKVVKRVEGLRFVPDEGFIVCCERALAVNMGRILPRIRVRALAVDENGEREIVALTMHNLNVPVE